MARRKSSRSAAEFLPESQTLSALKIAARDCRGCDLYKNATQTVFGDGSKHARIMLVGEQPGNREDLAGRPFVGPAGGILDKGLEAAGIDRNEVYVTNAVKHFKWEPRGKLRIHKKPNAMEITACRPWLEAEIGAIEPAVIVCLGATAAQALLGKDFRVTKQRGQLVHRPGLPPLLATVHPSAILRATTDDDRHLEMARFIEDLSVAGAYLRVQKTA